MYSKLNLALKEVHDFLTGPGDTDSKERVAQWMLDEALKARGYNNYQNFEISGEKFFFDNVLKKINPRVSIDVGANVGQYTNALLSSTNGIVIAFEPLDEPFSKLKDIQKQNQDRLILENKGVGLINEFLDIYYNNEATAHASFSKDVQSVPYLNNKLSKKIEVVSLDTFFKGKPEYEVDFIKIDTEGFEWEVLSGAKNVIKDKKPKAIQMEFNWHQMFRGQTLFSFSEMLDGSSPFQMLPNDLIRRDPKDPYSNIYHFSNFVFIRDDFFKL
jgi:FkbM family methyltransferase